MSLSWLMACKAKQNRRMSSKRKFLAFRILFIFLFLGSMAFSQRVNTVVLDAGHGGHDTGALGKHSREKDITLAIVLRIRDYIHENLKDVKVILTRDNDEFIELYRRAKIANENKADLFVSIHCNANPSSVPYGTETYVMGLHKSSANLAVAKAENAAILLEDDYVEQYDGFDPNSPEGNIFFSMMQNAFLDKSLDFAGRLQKQFRDKLNLADRGVKQAGFLVLYKTAMPGVLVETGFVSNAKDEKYLLSDKGQDQIAMGIFKAIREYKYAVERKDLALLDDSIPRKGRTETEQKEIVIDQPVKNEPEKSQEPDATLVYRVQFASYPSEKKPDCPEFRKLDNVWSYVQNGLYKYTAGSFASFRDASMYRTEVVNLGYKDAFVVPFYQNKRITIEEARRLGGN